MVLFLYFHLIAFIAAVASTLKVSDFDKIQNFAHKFYIIDLCKKKKKFKRQWLREAACFLTFALFVIFLYWFEFIDLLRSMFDLFPFILCWKFWCANDKENYKIFFFQPSPGIICSWFLLIICYRSEHQMLFTV